MKIQRGNKYYQRPFQGKGLPIHISAKNMRGIGPPLPGSNGLVKVGGVRACFCPATQQKQ
jgi:hypothetical protein